MTTLDQGDNSSVPYVNRLIAIGAATVTPQDKPDGSGSYVVIPDGTKVHEIADARYVGNHIKASVTVIDPKSLTDYIESYKDKDGRTVVFADQDSNTVLAVLNYHKADAVNRKDHQATLRLQFDPTYAEWRKMDGVATDQAEFARWLEENAIDIQTPDPAMIIEIARHLEVSTNIEFKKAVNLQNGLQQIQYIEQDNARTPGSIEIPKEITIKAPVYFGGEPQEIKFFFRYLAKNGSLKFRLDMHRKAYIEREAFLAISNAIGATASVPVYLGRAA